MGSLESWSQIMGTSSTTTLSRTFAHSQESKTTICPLPILKPTDKLRSRTLLKIIKTQLDEAKGIWPEELPSVLWKYRTTVRTPAREIPFRLAYKSKAVTPVEVGLTSYRVDNYDERRNSEAMHLQLDLVNDVKTIMHRVKSQL